jgi:hypothetical protein
LSAHPIEDVLAALEAAGVRYLVVGGVAVVLHGHLRTTADLDLSVALDRDNALRTVAALKGIGFRPRAPVPMEQFADARARASWVEDKGLPVFSVWSDRCPGLKVDLFVQEPIEFEGAWGRRVVAQLGSTRAAVASFADLLTMKRAAGRLQDLADVAALEALGNDESGGST